TIAGPSGSPYTSMCRKLPSTSMHFCIARSISRIMDQVLYNRQGDGEDCDEDERAAAVVRQGSGIAGGRTPVLAAWVLRHLHPDAVGDAGDLRLQPVRSVRHESFTVR